MSGWGYLQIPLVTLNASESHLSNLYQTRLSLQSKMKQAVFMSPPVSANGTQSHFRLRAFAKVPILILYQRHSWVSLFKMILGAFAKALICECPKCQIRQGAVANTPSLKSYWGHLQLSPVSNQIGGIQEWP